MVRALLCGSIPPEWGGKTGGGVASVHRTLIDELRKPDRDYGVEIAGLMPFNMDWDSPRRPPIAQLVEPPASGAGTAAEIEFYRRTLEATRADVVVFQHIGHRWATYHARLRPGIPAVGVIHSWHSLMFRPAEQTERVRRTIEEALPGCDALVFVSENTRIEGIERNFVYPATTSVIHNPVGPVYAEELAVDGVDRDGWVFLGSLIDRKNPMVALTAAARSGRRLTVVGDGPEASTLRAAAARLGGDRRVTFVGWAEPREARRLLLSAELLCLPSRSEGFSIAYLEALACGTPIIGAATNVVELEQRLGMACGVGIHDGSADEVLAASQQIATRKWSRSELRRRALAAYSPSAVTAAYATMLRSIVTTAGGDGPSQGFRYLPRLRANP
jgi:glycosyltransferase involved in cell wall biosynthesis